MIPGRLRHIVTIERQSLASDAYGERVATWAPLVPGNPTRRASIEPLSGREFLTASGEHSDVTTRIRLRHDVELHDLQPKDRVNHNGVLYDIVSVMNHLEIGRELQLMAKRWGGDS
jgi:SPP1 family predicted phage head-tail adaptor